MKQQTRPHQRGAARAGNGKMNKHLVVACVLAAIATMQAQAGALDHDSLSISGFGTLGAARSDTGDAQFARYNQAVGATDSPRIGLDSNLGLQATYTLSDTFSATAQVLTRKSIHPNFSTDLSWAFLKTKVNDELSLRGGRIVLPAFATSDYVNVGYANTMMRPPVEMYGQMPLENLDGVDANYQRGFGDTNVTAQLYAGVSSSKLFIPVDGGRTAKIRAPVLGLALSAEYGPVTARFSHTRAKVDLNGVEQVDQLLGALNSLGFGQLARDIAVKDKRLTFTAAGLNLDWRNIVVQTEYAQRRGQDPNYIPDSNAWYLMAGYRFGKVLPYIAHADHRGAGRSVAVPAALGTVAQLAPLADGVDSLLDAPAQSSNLIGVRWDFARSVALKVQIDRVSPKNKSGSLMYGPAAGQKDAVTVGAFTLDFVF